ncbi:hypothetical protein [Deferrisoma palaeochoriense]
MYRVYRAMGVGVGTGLRLGLLVLGGAVLARFFIKYVRNPFEARVIEERSKG